MVKLAAEAGVTLVWVRSTPVDEATYNAPPRTVCRREADLKQGVYPVGASNPKG